MAFTRCAIHSNGMDSIPMGSMPSQAPASHQALYRQGPAPTFPPTGNTPKRQTLGQMAERSLRWRPVTGGAWPSPRGSGFESRMWPQFFHSVVVVEGLSYSYTRSFLLSHSNSQVLFLLMFFLFFSFCFVSPRRCDR